MASCSFANYLKDNNSPVTTAPLTKKRPEFKPAITEESSYNDSDISNINAKLDILIEEMREFREIIKTVITVKTESTNLPEHNNMKFESTKRQPAPAADAGMDLDRIGRI